VNVILIISDTFRYDNLFGRAAMPVRTPELDRFATERAISCSRWYTASFPTIPQRTDMTTGRYGWPWHGWQDRRLSSANHAPEVLRQAGYVSQLINDCPHLFRAAINDGFDGSLAVRGQEGDTYFLRMNRDIAEAMPPEKTRDSSHFRGRNLPDLARWTNQLWYREEDRFAPRTARLAVEWLEENYEFEPFFLWVDFFDPHEPWDPPEYMVRRYDPEYDGPPMIHPNYGRASDLTKAELRNLRAHYCAEVEMVDRWVGRILQKVDDLRLWDNTIVVFTSDHGISLGEHDRTGKSNISPNDDRYWPLYPEIAQAPFLIAAPGVEGGRNLDALLQPPDFLPTVIELAGIDVTPPEPFHGRSFASMLRGEAQEPLHNLVITSTHLRLGDDGKLPRNNTPVLYTERWAYAPVGQWGEPELFDLAEDPYAERDVAGRYAGVVDELHGRLLNWMRTMSAPDEAIAPFLA
jgi:arylsulfatase A-like enzyme